MIKEKLAKLIDVKSIVTILLVAVFCYLNLEGNEVNQEFTNILMMIITFYFTYQAKKGEETPTKEEVIDESGVIENGD